MATDENCSYSIQDNALGLLIKSARLNQKLSQEQLGNILGVGKSCVSKWERGAVTNIGRDSLKGLAETLCIPLQDLLSIVPQEYKANQVQTIHLLDADAEELLDLYHRCTYEQRCFIKQVLNYIVHSGQCK